MLRGGALLNSRDYTNAYDTFYSETSDDPGRRDRPFKSLMEEALLHKDKSTAMMFSSPVMMGQYHGGADLCMARSLGCWELSPAVARHWYSSVESDLLKRLEEDTSEFMDVHQLSISTPDLLISGHLLLSSSVYGAEPGQPLNVMAHGWLFSEAQIQAAAPNGACQAWPLIAVLEHCNGVPELPEMHRVDQHVHFVERPGQSEPAMHIGSDCARFAVLDHEALCTFVAVCAEVKSSTTLAVEIALVCVVPPQHEVG